MGPPRGLNGRSSQVRIIFDGEIGIPLNKYAQKVMFYPCCQQFVIVFLTEIREKLSFAK